MSNFQKLQQWYAKQCNGLWEHEYGITIDTLDNPGWRVTIDLGGTDLEGTLMEPILDQNDEHDWLHCKIEQGKFVAHGDAQKLEAILEIFLSIVPSSPTS